jgi:hypothetical protein
MECSIEPLGVEYRVAVPPNRDHALGTQNPFRFGKKRRSVEPMKCLGGRHEVDGTTRNAARFRAGHFVHDAFMSAGIRELCLARVGGDYAIEVAR